MKALLPDCLIKIVFSALFFVSFGAQAQQHHYWNSQFGARSGLLGGAVIAGVNDNSAVYYNPAALTQVENGISLSANAYQFTWLKIKNALGEGIDVGGTAVDVFPQFAAGSFTLKNPKLRAGYALFTRDHHYMKMDERYETFTDAIAGMPGEEEFIGSFEYLNKVNEQWGALAVAYQLTDKFSVGLTQFIGFRAQSSVSTFNAEAIPVNLGSFYVARVRQHEDIAFNNFKAMWKVGFNWDLDRLQIGMTISTPSVNLNPFGLSSGRSRREFSVENLNVFLPDSLYPNFLASDKQTKIASEYKYPMTVGLGIEYSAAKTKISFSGEYFHEIKKYKVLQPESQPAFRPSNLLEGFATNEFLAVANHSKSVVNFAVGIEQIISPKWTWLAGFRTDFNTFDKNVGFSGTTSVLGEIVTEPTYWDLYHLSTGLTINKEQSKLTVGISYALSVSHDNTQFSNYDSPKDYNFFEGTLNNTAETNSGSFRFVIGYTRYAKKKK